jgi:hypothetical protein
MDLRSNLCDSCHRRNPSGYVTGLKLYNEKRRYGED